MNIWHKTLTTSLALAAITAGQAFGALSSLDFGPYTAASGGFPIWYQDENQLSLELCRSKAVSSRTANASMCALTADPGVFDDTLPMIFPGNWPGELFWMLAETDIPAAGNNNYELETYVAALEAAFSGDSPVDGDQVSFARIRIRATIPIPGTYVITHPYGVETIQVTGTGRRAINMTRDIGIGLPGDFDGALEGDVGPFLQSVNGPYTEVNPETGLTESFVGDPSLREPMTGSPFDTNFVRIEGPAGTIETNTFSLSGKVFDSLTPTAAEIERATYSRSGGSSSIDVFATSVGNAEVCFRETIALVGENPGSPCLVDMTGDNNGHFFGNKPAPAELPEEIVVTAVNPSGATVPTSQSRPLTDVVKITSAEYSWVNNSLTIEAVSSDEIEVPDLVAEGFGRLSKAGTTQTLSVPNLMQPPSRISVKSSAGGADTEMVSVIDDAPATGDNEPPVAANDSASTSSGVPIVINVLSNDTDPDGDIPLSIVALTQPPVGQGSVALNGSTSVLYTPPITNVPMQATFSYRAQDIRGEQSNVAQVTVSISANQAPVAVNDSAATLAIPIDIDVLANDTDPENNQPFSIVGLTQPANGQGTVSVNGSLVRYTPPTTVSSAFTATFTYQVQDALNAVSAPATVTVSVSPPPATAETINVATSLLRLRANDRQTWDFRGNTSLATGNTITVEVSTNNGPLSLGTATLSLTGQWRLSANTEGLSLPANPTATIRSAFGTVLTVPLTVR